MKKKLFFVLLMVASIFKLSAQSMSDVNYWVGDGQNQTMLVVNWTYADAVIAFGYRWDDSDAHYVTDMLAAFTDSIPNFNAVNSGGFIDDIEYTDECQFGYLSGYESEDFGYWMYGVNDAMANVGAGSQEMVDGDVIYFQYMIDYENVSYVTSSGLVINFIENFNTPIVTDITASVCSGDVYAENGFNIITTDLAPGVQSFTRRSEHVECQPDEVYNLELTINPTYEENQSLEIAQSDLPYTYGDTLFAVGTVSGEYRVYDETEAGCDSVIVLSLTVGEGTITSSEAQNVANLVVYQSSDAAQLFINAENDLVQISILSISGQTVLSVDAHNNQAVVDIANLQKGVYFVRALMADGTKQVAKFIIQ